MTDTVRAFYIQEEAKKGFKDWTNEGLEFALKNYKLAAEIKEQIEKCLKLK